MAPTTPSTASGSVTSRQADTPGGTAGVRRTRLTRRQRRRVSLGIQYALFVAVVVLIVSLADWHTLRQNFARGEIARQMFPDVITVALRNTVIYTLTGFAAGLLLGLVLALMRLSSVPPYRWLATAYVEIFRGLPALLIFIFVGVGVPLAFPGTTIPGGTVGKVALALALVSAAYMAETVRAGIQAVPRGQREAARSLGMSSSRAMISIVIPQAFRIIIPPLTNELVLLFKDSSLVLFLGVQLEDRELTKFGRDLASTKANITPILIAGLCYLVITVPLSYLARRLEARNAKANA
jgi:polar amino acid transport system permease protein